MPAATRYLFVVSMDVPPDKEAFFNEVYDTEHVPCLTAVPGVAGATRSVVRPLRMMLGGKEVAVDPGNISKSPGVGGTTAWIGAGSATTVCSRDAASEPTGTYSRRVVAGPTPSRARAH